MTQDTWINLALLLSCVAFFVWRGYSRGVIRSVQGLLSILLAYAASYCLVGTFAAFLQKSFSISSPLNYVFAALVLFFGTSNLVRFLFNVYIKRLEEQDEEDVEHEPARMLGVAIGSVIGGLLGLVLVWFSGVMLGAVQLKQHGAEGISSTREIDPVSKFAKNMIGGVVGYVVAQKTGGQGLASDLAARLISDPVGMSRQLSQPSSGDDIKKIQSDPRFIALSQKPEFQQLLENPSPEGILASPVFKELTEIVLSQNHQGLAIDKHTGLATLQEQGFERMNKSEWEDVKDEPSSGSSDQSSEDGHVIYRWTDEYGTRHFSQKKPDGNYALEVIRTP